MPSQNIPRTLESITCTHKFPWILEKSGLIEACLKNLGNGLVRTKVSSISWGMTMVKDTMDLFF